MIIAVCSAATPDLTRLLYLDSLQKKNQAGISVIVVPVQDFDIIKTVSNIQKTVVDSLKLGLTIGQPAYGKKTSGSQNKLLQWVTTVSMNNHFDYDLGSLQQVFVISETGRLFAVMQGSGDLGLYISSILVSKMPDN